MIEKKIEDLEQKLSRVTHVQKKLLNDITSFLENSFFKHLVIIGFLFVAFPVLSKRYRNKA